MNGDEARDGAADALAAATLGALLLVLPFEPRTPALEVLGLRFTLLELAAGVAALVLLWCGRRRLAALRRHPPPPLVLILAFAAVTAVSAWTAPAYRGDCARFALRMAAMAAFAWVFASSGARARRAGLVALIAGGVGLLVRRTAVLAGLMTGLMIFSWLR